MGQPVPVPPDPATLRQIAEQSGGRAFETGDAGELDQVYEQLGSRIGTRTEQREVSAGFAAGGLAPPARRARHRPALARTDRLSVRPGARRTRRVSVARMPQQAHVGMPGKMDRARGVRGRGARRLDDAARGLPRLSRLARRAEGRRHPRAGPRRPLLAPPPAGVPLRTVADRGGARRRGALHPAVVERAGPVRHRDPVGERDLHPHAGAHPQLPERAPRGSRRARDPRRRRDRRRSASI